MGERGKINMEEKAQKVIAELDEQIEKIIKNAINTGVDVGVITAKITDKIHTTVARMEILVKLKNAKIKSKRSFME